MIKPRFKEGDVIRAADSSCILKIYDIHGYLAYLVEIIEPVENDYAKGTVHQLPVSYVDNEFNLYKDYKIKKKLDKELEALLK